MIEYVPDSALLIVLGVAIGVIFRFAVGDIVRGAELRREFKGELSLSNLPLYRGRVLLVHATAYCVRCWLLHAKSSVLWQYRHSACVRRHWHSVEHSNDRWVTSTH